MNRKEAEAAIQAVLDEYVKDHKYPVTEQEEMDYDGKGITLAGVEFYYMKSDWKKGEMEWYSSFAMP